MRTTNDPGCVMFCDPVPPQYPFQGIHVAPVVPFQIGPDWWAG